MISMYQCIIPAIVDILFNFSFEIKVAINIPV